MKASAKKLRQAFANKEVLITGAGSGIGRATALAFAPAGARLSAFKGQPTDPLAAGSDRRNLTGAREVLLLPCSVSQNRFKALEL